MPLGLPALRLEMYDGGAALPIKAAPGVVRRQPRASFLGSREKKASFFRWIQRRTVGFFLLLFLSAAALFWPIFRLREGQVTVDIESTIHQHPASNESAIRHSERYQQPKGIPTPHPCGNFSYPPPPHDKKRTGPRPCPVCYVSVEQAMDSMPTSSAVSPVLKDLNYVIEENSVKTESKGGSTFGGHPTLQQRNESFDIKESMTVHCGFVKGKKPGRGTLFDIDDADLLEMEQCHGIVVASAIFGNYDIMQHPKNISEATKRSACFYMFVDEETAAYINNSTKLDKTKRVGLWRVVVVRNLPYADPRRNGKVPKLLLHRLFPNVRYSIWIDGKLELVVDPHLILERFLWRENAAFAISRHYKRFDVFEEGKANKDAKKYDNASIDAQLEFYRSEGLTHYSSAKLPITSDVPEGCVIIREHIPITNLFTCLWFNEVDRFTSRDQLSFSTVRDKIKAKVNLKLNMFEDCQRRNFINQVYHKDVMQQKKQSSIRQDNKISTKAGQDNKISTKARQEAARQDNKISTKEATFKTPALKKQSSIRQDNKISTKAGQDNKISTKAGQEAARQDNKISTKEATFKTPTL